MNLPASSKSSTPLATPIQFVPGVGPQRAVLLKRLGLQTVRDLLFCFPRDYVDLTEQRSIDELQTNEPASVQGTVTEVDQRTTRDGKVMLGVLLEQGDQALRGLWFNQPFMRERFCVGQLVVFSGVPRRNGTRWEMAHPRVQLLESGEASCGEMLPVYRLTDGLRQGQMRRLIRSALEKYAPCVSEFLPESFLRSKQLLSIQAALRSIHAPENAATLDRARHRFVYQELLLMQLALGWRRQHLILRRAAPCLDVTTRIDARIRRLFPFELTGNQERVIQEIVADLRQPIPMNRLLQGDVGSGKTAVAVYAMLAAVAHGSQAVLLAPTEVLARQHADTLQRLLAQSQVRVGYLSGSLTPKQRNQVCQELSERQLDLLVGTHTVLQSDVRIPRLALIVIDEQHRFGVLQRASLRQVDVDPHCLVMTATPIPRTLAMTFFGDLDISELRESPAGRQPVHTYLSTEDQRERWWEFFRQKLREGRQGYVISPRVDDSADETTSAESALENLANGELTDFRLDLLHGRLSTDEKIDALRNFQSGRTQVLVATSVVEVGIDVPNANLMTIEHGERFGLAQLHQLRGRVCRGPFAGYVCVFGLPPNDEAQRRLQAFVELTDGFELSEIDFQLRGPGELLGTRQHGLPALRIADLRRDTEILQQARTDARQLLTQDPRIEHPDWQQLKKFLLARYGSVLDLGDVG